MSWTQTATRWDGLVSLAVLHEGQRLAEIGDPNCDVAIASLTKPLVAMTTLMAHEEGSIDLDRAIEIAVFDSCRCTPRRGVTPRMLLAHASGLATDTFDWRYPPLTRRVYSNSGYQLLGAHFLAVVGMSLDTYFSEGIAQPLGLTHTAIGANPASSATTTVHEFGQIMCALMPSCHNGRRLLAPTTLCDAFAVQFGSLRGIVPGFGAYDPNLWGLGFEIKGTKSPHWMAPSAPPATVGHFGQLGSYFWMDPQRQFGVVALGREPFGRWAHSLWPLLNEELLEAFIGS